MFSANPSISPTGLKPSHVANGVGQGERGRTWGVTRSDCGERGRTGGERGRIGGKRGRTRGNGVGLGGTGSDWGERGRARETGTDWGEQSRTEAGTGSD